MVGIDILDQDILQVAEETGKRVLQTLEESKGLENSIQQKDHTGNIESLATGWTGTVLFLLELHKATGENQYLEAADRLLGKLVEYGKSHPTLDYSLYTGRCGLIYVLIQRYLLDPSKQHILNECLELIKPANREYLHNNYTSDYLYDGRAGTLLVLVNLYQLTGMEFLLSYAREFFEKIVDNVEISAEGISWTTAFEYSAKPSCSFARGVAGIRYAFKQVANLFPREIIDSLIKRMDQYLAAGWIESICNWGDYQVRIEDNKDLERVKSLYIKRKQELLTPVGRLSWANGMMGVFCGLDEIEPGFASIAKLKIGQALNTPGFNNYDLVDGIAGWGLCLVNNGLQDEEMISLIKERICKQLQVQKSSGEVFSVSLLHGTPGLAYFLLKQANSDETTESVLLPFNNQHTKEKRTDPILVDGPRLVEKNLSNAFPGTVRLLNMGAPELLARYCSQEDRYTWSSSYKEFSDFIQGKIRQLVKAGLYERIIDIFQLEYKIFMLRKQEKRGAVELYLDGILRQENSLRKLNNPDEWLLRQKVRLSGKVTLINSRWNWSIVDEAMVILKEEKIRESYARNLEFPGRGFSIIAQVFNSREVDLLPLFTLMNILIESLRDGALVGDIIQEVSGYYCTVVLGKPNPGINFLKEMDSFLLINIRQLIHRSIVIFESW
jgi:hypothetical protein